MPAAESRAERLAYRWCFLVVVAGSVLLVSQVWRTAGTEGLASLGGMALTSLLLLGNYVIFVGLRDDSAFSPWGLAVMVWFIDLLIAFSLLSGLERLERAPVLGAWLRSARRKAIDVLTEYPGLERMAFFGVAAFVMLPLAATGAVTGSFAARLVGLSRLAGVAAIACGALGTCLVFALLAEVAGEGVEELLRSPLLVSGLTLAFLVGGWVAWGRVKRGLRKR